MFKYILEIKNRFILLTLVWGSTILVSYVYKKTLLFLLTKPNLHIISPNCMYFIYTNITDIFSTYLQLIIFIGNQVVIVYFFYHVLIFLSPGLYSSEYKYLKLLLLVGVLFWIISIILLNNIFLPLSWKFFMGFQESFNNQIMKLYFEAKINEYVNFYISLYYICSVNCQIFTILIFFLNYINTNLQIIKQIRKVFYFFFTIFATIMTPPDVFSQILLSLSMIVSFEFLVIFNLIKTKIKSLN